MTHSISLQTKILSLMAISLLAGLASTLAVSTSVFMDDKGSYIVDYNFSQVAAAANSLESQVQKILLLTRLIHNEVAHNQTDRALAILSEYEKSLKLSHLSILNLSKEGTFKHLVSSTGQEGAILYHLDQLGWDSIRFLNSPVLIGKVSTGELALGKLMRSPDGGGVAYVFLMAPDLGLSETSSNFHILLMDAFGNQLFESNKSQEQFNHSEVTELLNSILDGKDLGGIKKWVTGHEAYLVGYQRLKSKDLTVMSLISEKAAFGAVQWLFGRMMMVGLSIILIAMGFMLILVKPIAYGLRSMTTVIQKVAQGDFSFRVNTSEIGEGEIGSLAASFNLMAENIDATMTKVIEKTETQQNEDLLSTLHASLFQKQPLEQSQIMFSAESLASHLYRGDWWHYQKIGDYVILILAKADGIGVPAALLTAAAQGAASTFNTVTQSTLLHQTPDLIVLIKYFNAAVYGASQGRQKLSCFIGMVDTRTGEIQMMNAGLPTPYLHRKEMGSGSDDPSDSFEALRLRKHAPLGTSNVLKVELDSIRLQAGDLIFWYTPGLLKTPNSNGQTLTSMNLFEFMLTFYKEHKGNAIEISASCMERFRKFFGDVSQNPPDDLSLGVLSIPRKASFKEREEVA